MASSSSSTADVSEAEVDSASKRIRTYNHLTKQQVYEYLEKLKQKRGSNVSQDISLIALIHFYTLVLEDIEKNNKHPDRAPKFRGYYDIVTNYSGICTRTLKLMLDCFDNDTLYKTTRVGNNKPKEPLIPRTNENIIQIKQYVREKRSKLELVQTRDIVAFMKEKNIIPSEYQYSEEALRRNVQRLLKDTGFTIGLKKGIVKENNLHLNKKIHYLKHIKENQVYREVYLDESYINNHHNFFQRSYLFEDDADDIPQRLQKKGRRLCFIAAIVGQNPHGITNDDDRPHILMDTLEIFEATSESGDYHGNFNSHLFYKWFSSKLMVALDKLGGNFAVIMDNAKYHVFLGLDLPKLNQSKGEFYNKMKENLIPCQEGMTKVDMITIYNKWKEESLPMVNTLALSKGHVVWYTPEYESELQPIEYLWAFVKSEAGRRYKAGTTLSDVKNNLIAAFNTARSKPQLIEGIIRHAKKKVDELYDYYNDNPSTNGISYQSINEDADAAIAMYLHEVVDGDEDELELSECTRVMYET